MSHSREDSVRPDVRKDIDRLSPTIPIRPGQPRLGGEATDPVPNLAHGSQSVNRITPHLVSSSTPIVTGSSLYRRGQRVGDFEIIEELARGGMGVIYKAKQAGLNRTVAIKMVLRGDFARFDELARFRTEAQAIARLHHPNLVNIYEIGEHDGLPFYAMEYLEGGTLGQRIDKKRMIPRAAAQLMLPLAQAIEYAHSRGIIHRDLKPSNILFASAAAPIDKNVAKITDFGVAKNIGGDSGLTRTGDILGTPSYMAPEQATGRSGEVGPAADVYSLGAILYELLTGRAPFVGADPADTLMQMLNNEPAPPRKSNPKVPIDLETICLKCLEKDPAKRYSSAALLADDLRRFLADEPILARPVPMHERLRKWVRRRPVQATMIAAGILLAALGVVSLVAVAQQAIAKSEAEAAMVKVQQEKVVEVQSLLADALLERGIALAEQNDVRRGMHWMIRSLEVAEEVADRNPKAASLAEAVRYNLAHWGSLAAPPEKLLPHEDWAWAVNFTHDGKTAITGGRDRRIAAWDVQSGAPRGTAITFAGPVWSIATHPSGYVFAGGGDGRGEIRSYRQLLNEDGRLEQVGSVIRAPSSVKKITLSPNGRYLLALLHSTTANPKYGGAILYAVDPLAAEPLSLHEIVAADGIRLGEFSHDSKKIFFASSSEIQTYSVAGKYFVQPSWGPGHEITALAMTPDRRMIAVSSYDVESTASRIDLWKVDSDPDDRLRVFNVTGSTKGMEFSPDARHLVISTLHRGAGDKDIHGQVHVAEVHFVHEGAAPPRTHLLYAPQRHARPVWAIQFHPSGKYFATGGEDGTSRLWDLSTGQSISQPLQHEGTVVNLAISPQGTHLITASAGGSPNANARLSELPSFAALPTIYAQAAVHCIAWDKDQRHFIAQDQALKYTRWDSHTRVKVADVSTKLRKYPGMYFFTNGVIREYDAALRRVSLFDAHSGEKLNDLPDFDLHPRDAPREILFADHTPFYNRETKKLSMYRIADNTPRGSVDYPAPPNSAFSHPATGRIAAILNDGQGSDVRVWNLDMNELAAWKLPNRSHSGLFNASGDIIALRGDYQFRFFDVKSGAQIYKTISHEGLAHSSIFHPKADLLLFAGPNGQIRCWHITSGKTIGKHPELGAHPFFLSARPDGTSFFAGARDLHIIEWPNLEPKTESAAWLKTWTENLTGMTFDRNDELTPIDATKLVARRQVN